MGKPKKNLTPEELAALREGLEQIRKDVRDVIAYLQARLGEKPA